MKSIEKENFELWVSHQKELDRRLKIDREGKMKWYSLEEVKLKLIKND